jgi:hypothetical protein
MRLTERRAQGHRWEGQGLVGRGLRVLGVPHPALPRRCQPVLRSENLIERETKLH